MQSFVWPSIGFYCLFGVFVFYQQLHGRNFRGSNANLLFALNASAFIGTVVGIAFLAYYAWQVSWWAAIVVFFLGVLGAMVGTLTERLVGAQTISLAGFVGMPVCAYLMFTLIP